MERLRRPDCTDPSGDPVVLYDQFTDRWILSQFTTSGLDDPTKPFWNCVAVSTTGDPTGSYYRYAFQTANFQFFPDYPKYGVWTDSYVLTTREFGPTVEYGIGVYALEKNKMVNGEPRPGRQLLPRRQRPGPCCRSSATGCCRRTSTASRSRRRDRRSRSSGRRTTTPDYGATFDALNIWDLDVKWNATPTASLTLNTQLPTAPFDSIFPCGAGLRATACRSRASRTRRSTSTSSPTGSGRRSGSPTGTSRITRRWSRASRSRPRPASPACAGTRSGGTRTATYSLYQQGTYAPADGVHRWMGSIAQDKNGDMALGYSVVNGTNVFPGIRYTGRLAGDPLGQMTLGEGTIINGSGVQTTTNSRWGDYTDMTVDPVDDCTFWYVNEYYPTSGTPADTQAVAHTDRQLQAAGMQLI